MSTVDEAIKAAADAVRALPDEELLELALRGRAKVVTYKPDSIPGFVSKTSVSSAPAELPTSALRQEVATSAPRPTGRGASRAAEAADKRQQILDLLRSGPLPRGEIMSRLGLTESSAHRALTALVDSRQVARPPLKGGLWSLR